jgi:hypothetical protein
MGAAVVVERKKAFQRATGARLSGLQITVDSHHPAVRRTTKHRPAGRFLQAATAER